MQNTRVLAILLLLIGLFSSVGVGACVEDIGYSHNLIESQDLSLYQTNTNATQILKSKEISESQQGSFDQELSYTSDFKLTQLLNLLPSESISISGVNPPTASFFKIRSQLYPDFFVKEYLAFGEDNFLNLSRYNLEIKQEWFLSISSHSSKRISGWKQSNLTANSKIYPQVFLIYI